MKGNYIFLANGYEPLEALAPMDVLRRAKLPCSFVSIDGTPVPESTQGYGIESTLDWDGFIQDSARRGIAALIFPGGLPGADNLGSFEPLMEILRKHFAEDGLTCAICAAPARVLARNLGTALEGCRMTAYDGFGDELLAVGADYVPDPVITDGNLITAKGPGLAIDFGLAILKKLVDFRIYDVVKHAMMI